MDWQIDYSYGEVRVIELVAFIRRNPALTPPEFRDLWQQSPVPLIRSKLPGLRSYKGYLPTDEAAKLDADAIVTLGFENLETLLRDGKRGIQRSGSPGQQREAARYDL